MQNFRSYKRGLRAACMLLLAVMMIQAIPAYAASAYVVKTSNAKLYAEASSKSKAVKVGKGKAVSVYETNGNWARVKVSGKAGYMLKSALTPKSSSASSSGYKTLSSGSKGSAVKKLQSRLNSKGYLSAGHVTGTYDSATALAVRQFTLLNNLSASSKATASMQKKLFSSACKSKPNVSNANWFKCGISSIFPRSGGRAYIVDVQTGIKLKIRRVGGTNHADVEPATKTDTSKLKKIYNGAFSWDSRGVVLIVGGKYFAAAINSYPHGAQISHSNGYDGQFCLHLNGSKTHGTEAHNPYHQQNVEKVYEYFH